jgi:signal transduction histidine kinase
MSRMHLVSYGVSLLAVAIALLLARLLPPGLSGLGPLFLAAVMVSAWYGGLGPGLLATAVSALVLDVLRPSAYWPGAGAEEAVRLGVFLLAALLISSLNARQGRLEAALRCKDWQKDRLLAVLAHELRNPLSAILTAVKLQAALDPGEGAGAREIIERQARIMARLIDDLLDVSRIGLGKLRLCRVLVDLRTPVRNAIEAVRPLARARDHKLDVLLPAMPLTLYADAARLEQILVNLLTNAVRYTEQGGHIWLTAEQSNGEITVRVRDTGIGVEPEVLPHLFDLFRQAENGSRGGLGIGLNLVKALVEMHGGRVTATSAGPGCGAEFVVSLPIAPPAAEVSDSAASRAAGLQQDGPILPTPPAKGQVPRPA